MTHILSVQIRIFLGSKEEKRKCFLFNLTHISTSQQTPTIHFLCARHLNRYSGYRKVRATCIPISRAPDPPGEMDVFSTVGDTQR